MTRRPPGMWAAVWLSLGPAVSNGFARFAYALILPAMRADLDWSYTQAGSMNSVNALGYLAGSLVAFYTIAAVGARRLFIGGMYATAAALALSALVTGFDALALLRFAAGVSGAIVFIAGGALAAALFPDEPRRAAAAIGIYFAGGGIGIVLPGVTLPWLFAYAGSQAWPAAWLAMGAAGLVISIVCTLLVGPAAAASAPIARAPLRVRVFAPILSGYFLFGVGYIAYMTFIIAWMRDHGSGPGAVAATWGALGLACVASHRVWRHPLAAWQGGRATAATILTLTAGASLPLLSTALPVMIASAILFGGALFIVPASVTAYAKKWLPVELWGKAVAGFTIAFSTGQILGPVLTGALSDATGSLFAGLMLSAAVLLIGAIATLWQTDPAPRTASAAERG
ncbi:MAG: YbfB/YjiJ family MFS transporter [Burkholderiales bacterium]|nr:YbfB/YjiJ family MFS transporter [Burkholderiales bacterium]